MKNEKFKEKGRRNKIVGQIGEYLASTELARRGFMVTPFSGNVPEFDLLAVDNRLKTMPIQVKTIRGGGWQLRADGFMDIEIKRNVQKVIGKRTLPHKDLIYIFILLGKKYGEDKFFLLRLRTLQNIIYKDYSNYLIKKKGRRPKNPQSLHTGVDPRKLAKYENNWGILGKKTGF